MTIPIRLAIGCSLCLLVASIVLKETNQQPWANTPALFVARIRGLILVLLMKFRPGQEQGKAHFTVTRHIVVMIVVGNGGLKEKQDNLTEENHHKSNP